MFSRHAISQGSEAEEGTYGAIALKAFPTKVEGSMRHLRIGDFVPGDVVMRWPLNNRRAMKATNFVRYFLTAAEADANRPAA